MRASWTSCFHPVARSADLVNGHVFHGRLLGQELALWRDAEGRPNAWENRCPHRGVRLTLGLHLGSELRCLYHGLRYASGSGRCTAIPSLGDRELPRQLNVCVKTFLVRERYGLVWASLHESASEPAIAALDGARHATLRSIVIGAPAECVEDALAHYRFVPSRASGAAINDGACTVRNLQELTLACTSILGGAEEMAILIVQPADVRKAIVHGVAIGVSDEGGAGEATNASRRRSLLRHHNERLCALRDALESTNIAPAASGQARELLEASA
ncbi:MAG: Rieske (2Fe-2S) protein [Betaproteobacteria bacterium]